MKRPPRSVINTLFIFALLIPAISTLVYLKYLKQDHERCGDACRSTIDAAEQAIPHIVETIEKKLPKK